ncbi:hypothetical protein KEM55_000720 [Ascosphaera atra]|nr:hypothetical protein KEM55_000720 [Ascosphaera atra]
MDEDRDFKLPVGSELEASEDATENTGAASPDARADNATAEQEPRVKFEAPPSPGQPEERDEATRLRELNAQVRDQDDLERGINQEAERLLNEQAHERDRKRLERAILDKTYDSF